MRGCAVSKPYTSRTAKAGKSFQANPVIGSKKRFKRPKAWLPSSKPGRTASDDIPEPLPECISRGSLYVAPEKPAPVPLADTPLPYGVPNARQLRRKILEAQAKRDRKPKQEQDTPAKVIKPPDLSGISFAPPIPGVRRKLCKAKSGRPGKCFEANPVNAYPKQSKAKPPADRAAILAELRSRKATQ